MITEGLCPWPLILRRTIRLPFPGHAASLQCLVWTLPKGQQNLCWVSSPRMWNQVAVWEYHLMWIEQGTQQGNYVQQWRNSLLGISSLFWHLLVGHPVSCKTRYLKRKHGMAEVRYWGGAVVRAKADLGLTQVRRQDIQETHSLYKDVRLSNSLRLRSQGLPRTHKAKESRECVW